MTSYLLDTNFISEAWKANKDAGVQSFLKSTPSAHLYLSLFTYTELRYGVTLLPTSARKRELETALELTLLSYQKRILEPNLAVANTYAELAAHNKHSGTIKPIFDMWIGATAKAYGFTLVTRNVKDFEDLDVTTLNPFHK